MNRTIRVFILDDQPLFCQTLAGILRHFDDQFEVTTSTDVQYAYNVVRAAQPPFDVFLLDLSLGPGRDGIEILKDLRKISPTTRAVICSASDEAEMKRRAQSAGASSFITKPPDVGALIDLLESL